VLACGVDVSYPRGHERLFDRIRATGRSSANGRLAARDAPSLPHAQPRDRRDDGRHGRGRGGGPKRRALDGQGSDRHRTHADGCARSGDVRAVGRLPLLRQEGVRCVTSAAEIIEELGRIGELAPLPQGPVRPRDGLSPQLRRVLEAVPKQRGATPEAIARTAGVSANDVRQALVQLVGAGFVEAAPGGWRLAGRRQRSTPAAWSLFDD
jgi:DNA processing protein